MQREIMDRFLSNRGIDVPERLQPAKIEFCSNGIVKAWWVGGKHSVFLNPMAARQVRGVFEEELRKSYLADRYVPHDPDRLQPLRWGPFVVTAAFGQRLFRLASIEDDILVLRAHGWSDGFVGAEDDVRIPIEIAAAIANVQRMGETLYSQPGEGSRVLADCGDKIVLFDPPTDPNAEWPLAAPPCSRTRTSG
jgi:hypothetical protein